ncbi:MAG: peptide chain release factor N(5)-glutamine methyltransferase [Actinomycetota bacterium]|nr:peptide chain release factor N(5)-glutamine methyltransferase [Actinomycetota bacterium]
MTPLQASLRAASTRLASAGVPSASYDARALAVHALGLHRPGDLVLVDELGEAHQVFTDLVERRAARVPLQHLVGRVGFRWLELEVGPGVFVPRPETEVVVQAALDALRDVPAPLCVDLCSGSGAVALALAQERPDAAVHAVEIDPAAMAWTRRNAAARAAAGDTSVALHLGDAATALPDLDGRVDLVISNPPYVATAERHVPDPEVLAHDPAVALWGGPDGLDLVRVVERTARRLLRPGGVVVVEHSDRQGRSAPAVFAAAGCWRDVRDEQDATGRDRFVVAWRTGAEA